MYSDQELLLLIPECVWLLQAEFIIIIGGKLVKV
jgi:hypothetical protein